MRIREETVMETKLKAMEGVNKVELFLWGFFYLKKKKQHTHTHKNPAVKLCVGELIVED